MATCCEENILKLKHKKVQNLDVYQMYVEYCFIGM